MGDSYDFAADAVSEVLYTQSGPTKTLKHLNSGTNRKVVLQITTFNGGTKSVTEPVYFNACSVFGGRFLI